MGIIDRLNRHPVVFGIFFLGAIASIVSLLIYLWPDKNSNLPESVDSTKKSWGVTKEYAAGGEDIIEGWLTTDTATWGATIPLPPFKAPPKIDFWRDDGAAVEKPTIVEKTADQFTVSIKSSNQAGKWMWRARGTKTISPEDNKSKEKSMSTKPEGQYLIQSYNSLELYDGDLTITLSSTVSYTNSKINLTVSTKGKEPKIYNGLSIGDKIFHEIYEITFIETQTNVSNYDVLLRVLKTDQT